MSRPPPPELAIGAFAASIVRTLRATALPRLAGNTSYDKLVAIISSAGAIFLVASICAILSSRALPVMLIAPIGASALLLFAIPSSPLAQPWAIIGGNVVSALVGVMTVKAAPSLPIAAGLSVGLSLAAMSVLRCLHPPGGSMALTAVVGGEATRQMGFNFPFLVVGTSSCALVLIGIAFHALVKRTYPHRTLTADTAVEQSAFCAADIDGALRDVGEVFDISKQDLEMIVRKVELNAAERRRNSRSR